MKKISAWALTLLMFVAIACQQNKDGGEEKAKLSIDFEKYTLPNGLEVILHQDKSDPIVARCHPNACGFKQRETRKNGFCSFL